jgi:hypothetical protein
MNADQKQEQSTPPVSRKEHVIAARGKSLDDLVTWAVGDNDNPFRMNVAEIEIKRRVAKAQLDAASATRRAANAALASAIIALVTLIVGIVTWAISAHK